jgi:hypothetical protein
MHVPTVYLLYLFRPPSPRPTNKPRKLLPFLPLVRYIASVTPLTPIYWELAWPEATVKKVAAAVKQGKREQREKKKTGGRCKPRETEGEREREEEKRERERERKRERERERERGGKERE